VSSKKGSILIGLLVVMILLCMLSISAWRIIHQAFLYAQMRVTHATVTSFAKVLHEYAFLHCKECILNKVRPDVVVQWEQWPPGGDFFYQTSMTIITLDENYIEIITQLHDKGHQLRVSTRALLIKNHIEEKTYLTIDEYSIETYNAF
jgi:hypothetical protein